MRVASEQQSGLDGILLDRHCRPYRLELTHNAPFPGNEVVKRTEQMRNIPQIGAMLGEIASASVDCLILCQLILYTVIFPYN